MPEYNKLEKVAEMIHREIEIQQLPERTKERLELEIEQAHTLDDIDTVRIDLRLSKELKKAEKEELEQKITQKHGEIYRRIEEDSDMEYLEVMAQRITRDIRVELRNKWLKAFNSLSPKEKTDMVEDLLNCPRNEAEYYAKLRQNDYKFIDVVLGAVDRLSEKEIKTLIEG
jgi:hypothetical protein